MTHLVKHILRTLSKFEEITRPPRRGVLDADVPDGSPLFGLSGRLSDELANLGADQLAEREAEEEVHEPLRVPFELDPDCNMYIAMGPTPEPPLSADELVAVRGLIQERYEPESVAEYMARAERVEGGYIIHELEDDDRLNDLAAATYSSATPTADDPAGVEHPPVPPAGIPLTGSELWSASHHVDLGAAKANNKYERKRLELLATRLRDAARALRK